MKVRLLTDADWPEYVDFAERYFGETHNVERDFNEFWFKRSHHDGWTGVVLENPAGRIAGVMMFLIAPAWFCGEHTEAAWISTGVVDDESRAKGGGALLYLWGYKNYPLVCALSGNQYSTPINDRLGEALPGVQMLRHVFVNSPKALEFCQPGRRDHVAGVDFSCRIPGSDDYLLVEVDDVPADYDALWDKARRSLQFTTDRTAQYLRWRYRQSPYIKYRFWSVIRGDRLVGFVVARLQETPLGLVCRVMDSVSGEDAAAGVWRQTIMAATKAQACFTDFLVIGSHHDDALAAAGFLRADADTGLDALPNLLSPIEYRQWSGTFHVGGRMAKQNKAWKSADALYFCKGDSDRDWPTKHELRRLSGL